MNIEINHSDLNYKVTQPQKAVSVSELLGKCYFVVPQFRKTYVSVFFLSYLRFSLSVEEGNP